MLHFFIQAWKSVIFVCLQIKYLWTGIWNLGGIPDFGRTANDILDSMIVKSLIIMPVYLMIPGIACLPTSLEYVV